MSTGAFVGPVSTASMFQLSSITFIGMKMSRDDHETTDASEDDAEEIGTGKRRQADRFDSDMATGYDAEILVDEPVIAEASVELGHTEEKEKVNRVVNKSKQKLSR